MADEEDQARRAQYAAEMKESEDELTKAREEWRAAIGEAKAKRSAAETAGPDVGKPDDLKNKLYAAAPELERALKVDVVGTFSAEATDRMGTGPTAVEERTARSSEETAKNTKKITQQLEQGAGMAFE